MDYEDRPSEGRTSESLEENRDYLILLDDWQVGLGARVFEWTVTADYAKNHPYSDVPIIHIAGGPIGDNESVRSWSVLMFHLQEDEAVVIGSVLAPTFHSRSFTFPERGLEVLPPSFDPFFLSSTKPPYEQSGFSTGSLHEHPVVAGDRIGFLVLLETATPVRFGVALTNGWEFMDANLDYPPINVGALRLDDCAHQILVPRDVDAGFELALQVRRWDGAYAGVAQVEFRGVDVWTGGVEIQQSLPSIGDPFVLANEVTLKAQNDAPQGWTVSAANFEPFNMVGTWSADLRTRNRSLQHEGIVAAPAVYGGAAYKILFGAPGYDVVAEGEGGSRSTFGFSGIAADLPNNFFLQIDLDRPLADIFGVPGRTFQRIHSGLAGTFPPTSWVVATQTSVQIGSVGGASHTVLLPDNA